jgi:tRNA-specific 2-thiouridylase
MIAPESIRVAVAMSGGVDSSVTAALCVEKYGKENVFGLTMKLFCYEDKPDDPKNCCNLSAVNDAASICSTLDIPHYVIDAEEVFDKDVVGYFVSEYMEGRTPNPCVKCNKDIKFGYLLDKAKKIGAAKLATGHYARVREENGQYELLKGVDGSKDQSYFLYLLGQEELSSVTFPLGELTKKEVRAIAKKLNLSTAEKPESQETCFVDEGGVAEFLRPRTDSRKGLIITTDGKTVGEHEGIVFYTIGQRKGLGGGFKKPMYVVGFDLEHSNVIIGPEEDLYHNKLTIKNLHWVSKKPALPGDFEGKIRYLSAPSSCILQEDGATVSFTESQRAITPGQSLVLYRGDVVMGGGIIVS